MRECSFKPNIKSKFIDSVVTNGKLEDRLHDWVSARADDGKVLIRFATESYRPTVAPARRQEGSTAARESKLGR